ncbi:MAG: SDR family oxidoreductase [Beijerinckiaceae bacterium]
MRLLILGYGYTARRFVQAYGSAFAAVAATGRSEDTLARIAADVLKPVPIADGCGADFAAEAQAADVILATAPPDAAGDPFLAAITDALDVRKTGPVIVYLSTVGVYGDQQGRWVDEMTPAKTETARSRYRLGAEQGWQALGQAIASPVAVLRLAGIYGPERSALDHIRAGTARRIIKPGQVFNRIHVDDIAHAVMACVRRRADGVWNIADDEPSPPQDVIAYAAALLGVPPPPDIDFDTATFSPMAREFYSECKRISNAAAKGQLGWRPVHRNYRAGLSAIFANAQ